ncbi:asparaginase [Aquibacillus kalidii]|uniref:asparaginase n=1 Tax=Aquibacillus kalidii TaxID=2762597 RepID=UPI00164956F3|nr:asparaginase [Aquibacillus kalidii]
MKKILIVHTGGTISMKEDRLTGEVSVTDSHPLENLGGSSFEQRIEEDFLYNLPSPHITPYHMINLAKHMKEKIQTNNYSGIVVTHGTDTLEETAYFLDLYLQATIPIVITGAMRSSNEIGSDGLYNLLSAIKVVSTHDSVDKGVLVVMNDEIHTAKYVTKTSTSNVATFQSPQFGPIGIITKQSVHFYQKLITDEVYPVSNLTKKVALIKTYAGMESTLIEAIYQSGIDGLIIEGLGQGNVPETLVKPLETMLNNNVPIVLVSRCFKGIVQPTYSYNGGGKQLKDMGVIFTNGLTGPKARIKLLIALEITQNIYELQRIFDL